MKQFSMLSTINIVKISENISDIKSLLSTRPTGNLSLEDLLSTNEKLNNVIDRIEILILINSKIRVFISSNQFTLSKSIRCYKSLLKAILENNENKLKQFSEDLSYISKYLNRSLENKLMLV